MPTEPVAAADLLSALSRHQFSSPLGHVAAFLASPTRCLPGVHSGSWAGRLWVRDESRPCASSLPRLAAAAADAAQAACVDGDHFLDLSTDPATWFKVVRSGTRRRVFGIDLLWGGPSVTADDGVSLAQIAAFAQAVRRGSWAGAPGVLGTRQPVLVDGSREHVVLRPVRAAAAPPAPTETTQEPGRTTGGASGGGAACGAAGGPGSDPAPAWGPDLPEDAEQAMLLGSMVDADVVSVGTVPSSCAGMPWPGVVREALVRPRCPLPQGLAVPVLKVRFLLAPGTVQLLDVEEVRPDWAFAWAPLGAAGSMLWRHAPSGVVARLADVES